MEEILNKLSSYNIFNYLLPGVLFVAIAKYFTDYDFILDNNFVGAFLYYFIGMMVSRFGSLMIEPVLKKVGVIKFADYTDYISASKIDTKIELFSAMNNTYRTIVSMFFLLLILKLYNYCDVQYHISKSISFSLLIVLGLIVFLFAYRKQTDYIKKRVELQKDRTQSEN